MLKIANNVIIIIGLILFIYKKSNTKFPEIGASAPAVAATPKPILRVLSGYNYEINKTKIEK
jgi:hypothetical protein